MLRLLDDFRGALKTRASQVTAFLPHTTRDFAYTVRFLGGGALVESGLDLSNEGRVGAGLWTMSRSAIFSVLAKRMPEKTADGVVCSAATFPNSMHAFQADSAYESAGAISILSANVMRAVRNFGIAERLSNSKAFVLLPTACAVTRGVMQAVHGYEADDLFSVVAGSSFVISASLLGGIDWVESRRFMDAQRSSVPDDKPQP